MADLSDYEGGILKKPAGIPKNSKTIPLYKRLRFQDNYTDPNFLADLEVNPSMHYWNLADTIEKTTRLSFQMSISIVFFIFYHHLSRENLDPSMITQYCWMTSVVAHFFYQTHRYWSMKFGFNKLQLLFPLDHLKVTMIYVLFSYQLAPILRTLTATISTDTIHATAIIMISTHLLTNDYGVPGFFVSKTVSVNTAIIGSICLASRLPTDVHSLALMTIAVQGFALFPVFSGMMWDSAIWLAITIVITSYACITISINYVLSYLCLIMFINGFLPVVFVSSQKFKRNVYGPWDEAVPNLDFVKKGRSNQQPPRSQHDIFAQF